MGAPKAGDHLPQGAWLGHFAPVTNGSSPDRLAIVGVSPAEAPLSGETGDGGVSPAATSSAEPAATAGPDINPMLDRVLGPEAPAGRSRVSLGSKMVEAATGGRRPSPRIQRLLGFAAVVTSTALTVFAASGDGAHHRRPAPPPPHSAPSSYDCDFAIPKVVKRLYERLDSAGNPHPYYRIEAEANVHCVNRPQEYHYNLYLQHTAGTRGAAVNDWITVAADTGNRIAPLGYTLTYSTHGVGCRETFWGAYLETWGVSHTGQSYMHPHGFGYSKVLRIRNCSPPSGIGPANH